MLIKNREKSIGIKKCKDLHLVMKLGGKRRCWVDGKLLGFEQCVYMNQYSSIC